MKTDDRFIVTLPEHLPAADLKNGEVDFDILVDGIPISGTGQFYVRTLRRGKAAYVSILSLPPSYPPPTAVTKLPVVHLTQNQVDKISKVPGADQKFSLQEAEG